MYSQVDRPKENKSRAVANSVAQKKRDSTQGLGFVDNRPTSVAQRKIVFDKTKEDIIALAIEGVELVKKYETDRAKEHIEYVKTYDFFLKKYKDSSFNFLEVGTHLGESVKMWREYFTKAFILYGF